MDINDLLHVQNSYRIYIYYLECFKRALRGEVLFVNASTDAARKSLGVYACKIDTEVESIAFALDLHQTPRSRRLSTLEDLRILKMIISL